LTSSSKHLLICFLASPAFKFDPCFYVNWDSMLHLNNIKKKGQSIKLIGDFQLLHLLNFYLQTKLKTINLSIQHQIWNDKESKSVKRKRTYQGLFKFSKSLVNSFGPALGKGQPPHLCHVPAHPKFHENRMLRIKGQPHIKLNYYSNTRLQQMT